MSENGPILKGKDAAALSGALQAFNFRSVEEQARQIVEQARKKADEIIKAAHREVDRLREEQRSEVARDAYEEGFAKGIEEGRRKGEQEGRAEGRKSARDEFDTRAAPVFQALKHALSEFDQARSGLIAQAEQDLLTLALAVAARITRKTFEVDPARVGDRVRGAVELVSDRTAVDVFVSKADLTAANEILPDLQRAFADLKQVVVHSDESLPRGSVRVTTGRGQVVLDVEQNLAEICRAILGDDGPERVEAFSLPRATTSFSAEDFKRPEENGKASEVGETDESGDSTDMELSGGGGP